MGAILQVGSERAQEIGRLRTSEYARSHDLTLTDDAAVRWNAWDDAGIVLAAVFEGRLVATMSGVMLESFDVLARRLGTDVPRVVRCMPVLFLRRAATDSAFRKLGLNTLLRYHFILAAQACGVPYVVGAVVQSGARVRTMGALGYSLVPAETGASWFHGHGSATTGPVLTGVLDVGVSAGEALRRIESTFADALRGYPAAFARLDLSALRSPRGDDVARTV